MNIARLAEMDAAQGAELYARLPPELREEFLARYPQVRLYLRNQSPRDLLPTKERDYEARRVLDTKRPTWSGKGVLLASGDLLKPAIQNQAGDMGAEYVTLALQAEDPQSPGHPANQNVIATLRWGVGDGSHQAQVSVRGGTHVSLITSKIEVLASYLPSPGVPAPKLISFHVSAAYGSHPSYAAPRFDVEPNAPLADGDSLALSVPEFADRITVQFSSATQPFAGGGVTGTFARGPVTLVSVNTLPPSPWPFNPSTELLYPQSADTFTLTNHTGAPIGLFVSWGLFL